MQKTCALYLLAVSLVGTSAGRVAAQAITTAAPPQAKQQAPQKPNLPIVPPAKQPPGAYQLRVMYLPKTLYLRNSFWAYQEYDPDLPPGASVEQLGTATFGGSLEEKHGAFVRYRVQIEPDADRAHLSLARFAPKTAFNVKQTIRRVSGADEGVDYSRLTLDNHKIPQLFRELTVLRYGPYVVWIESQSDMRAPGPRPAKGQRQWMSQPAHATILSAVQRRWADYKTLLAKVDVKVAAAQRTKTVN